MKKMLVLLSATFALSQFIACTKMDFPFFTRDLTDVLDNGETPKIKQSSVDYRRLSDTLTEAFTINPSVKDGQIVTRHGTTFQLPTDGFVNAKKQSVSGAIRLYVRELRRPSEMLLSDKSAQNTEGGILESFGEFCLVATTLNGEPLQLADGKAIAIAAPIWAKNDPAGVPMWAADTTILRTKTGLNSNGEKVSVIKTIGVSRGTVWQRNGEKATVNKNLHQLEFEIKRLNEWHNCDILSKYEGEKTTILCYFTQNYYPSVLADDFGSQPSAVFFKPKNLNSLVKFYSPILNPTIGKMGFHSYEKSVPVGIEGKLVALSCTDGRYFIEVRDVTIPEPAAGQTFVPFSMMATNTKLIISTQIINGVA